MAGNAQRVSNNGVGRILRWTGDEPPPSIPDENYATFFLSIFSQHREKIALVNGSTGKSYTYQDLIHMVLSIRTGLTAAGVKAGDSVILLSSNHIEMPAVIFATVLLGAICVPVNPMLTKEELAHIIRTSRAKWAVANVNVVEKLETASDSLGPESLKNIWVIGDDPRTWTKRPSLDDLKKSEESNLMTPAIDPATTVALMPFSSGTTGLPKGVMLSHRNLVTVSTVILYNIRKISAMTDETFKSILLFLPVCHIYGYLMMGYAFLTGGKLVFLDKFSTKEYFETIPKYKITFTPLTPHLVKLLMKKFDPTKHDLSSIIGFTSGSAPLSASAIRDLNKKTGKLVFQGYGLTETSGVVCVGQESRLDSVGKMLPLYEGKVVDVETGQLVGEGQEGELCVRGPYIMLGYANNPKATAEMIDSDGWLHTGDLCYYDEENFIYIIDRLKDTMKVKGYQVSPTELEKIIQRYKGVSEVTVTGVPNERLGEAPKAWVVPVEGATINKEALVKYVADNVAPYKQLTGGVEVVKGLPRNFMNKVLRRKLISLPTTSRLKL